jgi:hypothetical protein
MKKILAVLAALALLLPIAAVLTPLDAHVRNAITGRVLTGRDWTVTGDWQFNSNIAAGDAGAISQDKIVDAQEIFTNVAAHRGLFFQPVSNPSATETNAQYGAQGNYVTQGAQNFTAALFDNGLQGVAAGIWHQGSGTLSLVNSFRAETIQSGGGTISELNQYLSVTPFFNIGTITDAYAFRHKGFGAGVTTPWAFYNDSTDQSFFGGNILLPDNIKLRLGAGLDGDVFSDGTNPNIAMPSGKGLDITGEVSIGNGAPSATKTLVVTDTYTSTGGPLGGIDQTLNLNPSGVYAHAATGVTSWTNVTSGNSQNFTSELIGVSGTGNHQGSGVVSSQIGLKSRLGANGAGTITTLTNFYSDNTHSTTTLDQVGTGRGFYHQGFDTDTTTQWAFYANADPSFFGERVEIESPSGLAVTALDLEQKATGSANGSHINFDDKAGTPGDAGNGDLWRNGTGLYYHDGTNAIQLNRHMIGHAERHISTPVAANDFTLYYASRAITITKVVSHITGGTNVVYNINHATTRTGTGLDVFTSDITETDVDGAVHSTGFNDETIPAGSVVWLDLVSESGSPTDFFVQIEWTED